MSFRNIKMAPNEQLKLSKNILIIIMKNIDKSPYMRQGSLKPPNLNSKDQIIAILDFYITANYYCIK